MLDSDSTLEASWAALRHYYQPLLTYVCLSSECSPRAGMRFCLDSGVRV